MRHVQPDPDREGFDLFVGCLAGILFSLLAVLAVLYVLSVVQQKAPCVPPPSAARRP